MFRRKGLICMAEAISRQDIFQTVGWLLLTTIDPEEGQQKEI